MNPTNEVVRASAGAASSQNRRFRATLFLVWLTLIVAVLSQGARRGVSAPRRIAPRDALLALGFEANRGQHDRNTQFSLRTPAGPLQLTSDSTVMRTRQGTLRASWPGARPGLKAVGLDPRPERITYFEKRDMLHTRSYDRVRYDDVYPGIDLEYYRYNGELEHDWIVAPGADPGRIRMRFDGVVSARLTPEGDLALRCPDGDLLQRKPVIYQQVRGERIPVQGAYAPLRDGEFGFQLSTYDRSRPLVIDPVLEFSTYLGGVNSDVSVGLALDGAGRPLIAGNTTSIGFPRPLGIEDPLPETGFLLGFKSTGEDLDFISFFEGVRVAGVAVGPDGLPCVTGSARPGSVLPTPGGLQAGSLGLDDVVVMKLSANGADRVFGAVLGGSNVDNPSAIHVDAQGRIYVAGSTGSQDLPVRSAFQPIPSPESDGINHIRTDGFILRLSPDGSGLDYCSYAGNVGRDGVVSLAVGSDGAAFILLVAESDFPHFSSGTRIRLGSALLRLSEDGSSVLRRTLPGENRSNPRAFVVATDGSVFVASDAGSPPSENTRNLAIDRLSSDLATRLDTLEIPGSVPAEFLATDGDGFLYLAGNSFGAGAPLVNSLHGHLDPAPERDFSSYYFFSADAFLMKIQPDFRGIVYSTYLGGSSADRLAGVAPDVQGNVFLTGTTISADFPVAKPFSTLLNGKPANRRYIPGDAFLVKIRSEDDIRPHGRLSVSARELRFRARLPQGSGPTTPQFAERRVLAVTLANVGKFPLRVGIGSIQSQNTAADSNALSPFHLETRGRDLLLNPGKRHTLTLRWEPTSLGTQRALLPITSDDPKHALTHIRLVGTATR